jgi:6-phosphogluconolactonase
MTAVIHRFADPEALADAAADELARLSREAVAERGICHLALSGGSTPKRMYERLVARGRSELPWSRVEIWWGDERTVPPDHIDSNYRMAHGSLFVPLNIDGDRVHRMRGELSDHGAAARAYEAEALAVLGTPPVFDVVLLGMGPDGHTASLFPDSPALIETARWVVANPVTSPLVHGSTTRLTLTAPAINAARHVRFVVSGADKAAALAAVLEGRRDPRHYPAQLVSPSPGDLAWLVDEAAASRLGASA